MLDLEAPIGRCDPDRPIALLNGRREPWESPNPPLASLRRAGKLVIINDLVCSIAKALSLARRCNNNVLTGKLCLSSN